MNYYLDINDFNKDAVKQKYLDIKIREGKRFRIQLAMQKTGYGFKHFFKCPKCGSRHTELYYCNDMLMCRVCCPSNIYKGIQNCVKGGNEYIAYRMKRYAVTHGIEIMKFPFDCTEYEKPDDIKVKEWVDSITVLQALENMRYQTLAHDKKWSTRTVRSVLNGSNLFIYIYELSVLLDRRNIIHWDQGVT